MNPTTRPARRAAAQLAAMASKSEVIGRSTAASPDTIVLLPIAKPGRESRVPPSVAVLEEDLLGGKISESAEA